MLLGPKTINARKGVKTKKHARKRAVRQVGRPKTINARKGVKTSASFSSLPISDITGPKTINARKGVKTDCWRRRLWSSPRMSKNYQCP